MDMCPLAADWGNVADWAAVGVGLAAAIATFAAVLVSLRASRRAIEDARLLRTEERQHQAEVLRLRAVARAIVFDVELFQLGGILKEIQKRLSSPEFDINALAALEVFRGMLPKDPLPSLSRFASEIDAFGVEDAGKLLHALSTWSSFSLAPTNVSSHSAHSNDRAHMLIRSIRPALANQIETLRVAREVTRRWAAEVQSDVPDTSW